MHKDDRSSLAGDPIFGRGSVDHELSDFHDAQFGSEAREDSRRTRYRLAMARTRRTQDEDVIARLADAGEDAFRRLIDLPRRIAVGAMNSLGERLQSVATKLGGDDPLARRMAALEERLDSLEKPTKTTTRRASTSAKRSAARKASPVAAPAEPAQQGRAPAEGEAEHAR